MKLTDFLGLFGGLALFLYGMQMMSEGLEDAAGNRMKKIMEKLTSNRLLGVAVGAGITAVIQSSSATTVMVVGFVNSGMMTLRQAVWIIMGANIGTTITGQLIALDVDLLAPLFAFLGVALLVFVKAPRLRHLGKILAGLGVLFIGMDMMGAAMHPLRESEAFISLMTRFSNPLLGILAGTLFTAVIQSSSASIGILQTLAAGGLIGLPSAVYVLFGQNIGTCITAAIASVGASRSAKRAMVIHLLFNVTGTLVFTLLCMALPVTEWVSMTAPGNTSAQIANMHTVFNIATTALLLPLGTYMAKLAERMLPDKKAGLSDEDARLAMLEDVNRGRTALGYSAIHTDVLRQEIEYMLRLAGENVQRCYRAVLSGNAALLKEAEETEETIDKLNKELSQYISKILAHYNGQNVAPIEEYFLITGNAERIGDHALNIGGYVEVIKRKDIVFSESARKEIAEMQALTGRAIDSVLRRDGDMSEWLADVAAMEQQMDDMTVEYREQHLNRMRQGLCSEEACVLYSEMLTDFERIGDHVLNIAQAYTKIAANE